MESEGRSENHIEKTHWSLLRWHRTSRRLEPEGRHEIGYIMNTAPSLLFYESGLSENRSAFGVCEARGCRQEGGFTAPMRGLPSIDGQSLPFWRKPPQVSFNNRCHIEQASKSYPSRLIAPTDSQGTSFREKIFISRDYSARRSWVASTRNIKFALPPPITYSFCCQMKG